MFHSFFSSLAKPKDILLFRVFFYLHSVVCQDGKVFYLVDSLFFFFFLLSIAWSGLLTRIGLSVCITKSQKILCISFFRMDSGLCTHHLSVLLLNRNSYLKTYNHLVRFVSFFHCILTFVGYLMPKPSF